MLNPDDSCPELSGKHFWVEDKEYCVICGEPKDLEDESIQWIDIIDIVDMLA